MNWNRKYRKIKEDAGSTIARLEIRLSEVNLHRSNHVNIKKVAQDAANALSQLDKLYDIADIPGKRYLVGLLFQKIHFHKWGLSNRKNQQGCRANILGKQGVTGKKMGQKPVKKSLPHKG